jgi:bifunctional UDP-N-acetylglucosamine pyrophosphorylase/glucosamine-1-phosphate N-acetyltransferase
MRSAIPKVLHTVAGLSMVGHALYAVQAAGAERIAVVIGPDRLDVAKEVAARAPGALVAVQSERKGTAHAVLAARAAFQPAVDDVLVVFGDTPLVTAQTLSRMRARLAAGADVVALAFEARDPTGYGRMITDGERLQAIVEHKDATESQRAIRLCNGGLMALSGAHALALLERIGNANAQGEYYLTDAAHLAGEMGLTAVALSADEDEVRGVNDRVQLAQVEALMQARLREAAMRAGVTLHDPASVHLCHDTQLARDVTIEPHVVFGPGVSVGEGAVIHAFCHLEGASVAAGASIGPFARLRPGARLGEKAKIGNFVEIKGAEIGPGAKVNHLSYVGDASVGAGANIGAGVITCNYDGFAKHRTVIGEGAFIGSNSALVAPVTIAAGAYVGSGSVITKDVAPDALAVARGRQAEIAGWAATFRAKQAARKKDQGA